jgi:hypothetical protein
MRTLLYAVNFINLKPTLLYAVNFINLKPHYYAAVLNIIQWFIAFFITHFFQGIFKMELHTTYLVSQIYQNLFYPIKIPN